MSRERVRSILSFASRHKTAAGAIALALTLLFLQGASMALYIPTARDTLLPPLSVSYDITDPEGYTALTKQGPLQYYFREDRDVIMVEDTRNGYTWKTGIDMPFRKEIEADIKSAATDAEKIAAAIPREENLNATYLGMANSLMTVEFFDSDLNIQFISSASEKDAESALMTVSEGHYRLDTRFTALDLSVSLHIYCTDKGLEFEILDTEITGDQSRMAAILIAPFLGASGGRHAYYDAETMKYGDAEDKPITPGYAFIPDGSGALVRFRKNSAVISRYVGSVYGSNPSENTYYYSEMTDAVAVKSPLMPVFGIAHGDRQSAFVSWAEKGTENLEIVLSPAENVTSYTYCYPRFVYNKRIHQVYNRNGDGYFDTFGERNHFDVRLCYQFLGGDGSEDGLPADYVGMAQAYRAHLEEIGALTMQNMANDAIPIRLDFLMSDVKKSIAGNTNVVTTTAEQVGEMLTELTDLGVSHISSGLHGFQSGGVTTGKPWALNFTGAIGSSGDYKKLFQLAEDLGADVSFAQDYSRINSLQMFLPTNQAYHKNGWGVRERIRWFMESSLVNEISYARPDKSVEWLEKQSEKAIRLGAPSVTVGGLSEILLSHNSGDIITTTETINLYQQALAGIDAKVNAVTPNAYLWSEVDRFLNAPVLSTQYILETDTVPFLQMVLAGTMELYTPYANFSLYTTEDVLRMIDYNIYPSFMLTHNPSHLLSSTNSSDYYSTEYSLYRDIIQNVYHKINEVLSKVAGKRWVDRVVLQNGVILNSYEDGTQVLINYTDTQIPYHGSDAPPYSAVLLGGGSS